MPLLCLLAFVVSLQLAMLLPILPNIVGGLGISIPAAGQLVTANLVASALAVLVTGLLSDAYGRKRFLVAALGLNGIGILTIALAPGYGWAVAGCVVVGLGAGIHLVNALAGDWYSGTQRDRLVARLTAMIALAGLPSTVFVAAIAQWVSWRIGLEIPGIVCLVYGGGSLGRSQLGGLSHEASALDGASIRDAD